MRWSLGFELNMIIVQSHLGPQSLDLTFWKIYLVANKLCSLFCQTEFVTIKDRIYQSK
jgi:hypothetical protein